MHTKRVIPCLDVKDGRVVKGVNFVNFRDAGDPSEVASAYDAAGADEVVFLDITARSEEHTSELQSRCTISYAVFCSSNAVRVGAEGSQQGIYSFHCRRRNPYRG